MDKVKQLENILIESKGMVFFGGAGVSTESGIPDFRSTDGLYQEEYAYPPETIVSHSFYRKNTKEFYRFYRNRMIYPKAKPNEAHIGLARLEDMGICRGIVTQNIDGLHQMAGSKRVYELHGSVHRNYCESCGEFYNLDYILQASDVPQCSCGAFVKPDVVLYEEGLDDATVRGAINLIREADTLIIGGTSLLVYPAAGMIDYFAGRHLVVINKAPTSRDQQADLLISAPIGEVFGGLDYLRLQNKS